MPDVAPLDLLALLPEGWRTALAPHLDPARAAALGEFVAREYATATVFPPVEDLFSAYRLCAPSDCRVLILGQDPYHRVGQAHGLSFSVREGVSVPPSLRNVFKELGEDLGVPKPRSGNLDGWAAQGVLLLNSVLTVRQATPGSHANRGWEEFTDATIRALDALADAGGVPALGRLRAQEGGPGQQPAARGAGGGASQPDEPARFPRQPSVQRGQQGPRRRRPAHHRLGAVGRLSLVLLPPRRPHVPVVASAWLVGEAGRTTFLD